MCDVCAQGPGPLALGSWSPRGPRERSQQHSLISTVDSAFSPQTPAEEIPGVMNHSASTSFMPSPEVSENLRRGIFSAVESHTEKLWEHWVGGFSGNEEG